MSRTDVKMVRLTGTGAASIGRSRVKQLLVTTGAGAGRLTLSDGNGGATVLDIDLTASQTYNIDFGGDMLFSSDVFVATATNITALTVFY